MHVWFKTYALAIVYASEQLKVGLVLHKFEHYVAQNRTTKQRYVDKYSKILSFLFFSFNTF